MDSSIEATRQDGSTIFSPIDRRITVQRTVCCIPITYMRSQLILVNALILTLAIFEFMFPSWANMGSTELEMIVIELAEFSCSQ